MLVSDIFTLLSGQLQDVGEARRWPWESSEGGITLVDLANAALREIAQNRPDATAVTEAILLETGSRQTIPSVTAHGASKNALSLLEVIQNMGLDGTTPGEPCFKVTREAMSAYDWNVTGTEVDNYAYDKLLNPQVYYVSPSLSERTYVEVTYSSEPDTIVSQSDRLPIPDTFAGPVQQWMLYLIYAGDNSDANYTRALHCATAFYQSLGVKLKADLFFPVQVKEAGA
jgi:hypothetical protein